MNNLVLEGTRRSPSVDFNHQSGVLKLLGRSIPENAIEFYKPLNEWLDAYASAPRPKTTLIVQLEYFNTSSSKCILDLFKRLEQLRDVGNEVEVLWHYEQDDEDMLEAGEDYQGIIKLPFRMIEVEDMDFDPPLPDPQ